MPKYKFSENVIVNDKYDNKYYSDNFKSNDDFSSASAKNVKIRLKDDSRIVGSILKRDNGINIIKDSQYTPCIEKNYLIENCPGWKLKAETVYHPVGTCKMGFDQEAVVDKNLKVHGLKGLRIADASIMPTLISGNTNAACMMIGERCADFISKN